MKDKKNKEGKLLIIIISILLILDQFTKWIFLKKGIITKSEKIGFGNEYYIIISLIIVLMIIRYISRENMFIKLRTKIILAFGIAGAIGNVIDRIWAENVLLFIKLGNFLDLNLSYIYIYIAWIGMAVILTKDSMKFLKERKNKRMLNNEDGKNNSK